MLVLLLSVVVAFHKPLFANYSLSPSRVIGGLPGRHGTIAPQRSFFIDPNLGFQTEAHGYYAQHEVRAGRPPVWNPYDGAGQPLLANMQGGVGFPLLYLFDFGKPYDFTSYFILAVFLAGLGTFLFLGALGYGLGARLAGSFIYMFSGMFFWLYFPPAYAIATFPFMMWAAHRVLREGSLQAGVLLADATYASVASGFPEVSFLSGVFVAAYALCFGGSLTSRAAWRCLARVLVSLLLGVCLAGYIVLPFLEYVRQAGGGSRGFGIVSLGSFGFAGQLMPFVFGYIGSGWLPGSLGGAYWGGVGGYIGSGGFVLALMALTTVRRGMMRIPLFFGVAATLTLLHMFGFPGLSWIGTLPVWRQIAFFRYSNFLLAFCVAVLTAHAMSAARLQRARVIAGASSFLTLLAIALLLARPATDAAQAAGVFDAPTVGRSVVAACVVAALLALILLLSTPGRLRNALLMVIVLAELIAYISTMFRYLPPTSELATVPNYVSYIDRVNHDYSRVYTLNGYLMPNYAEVFRLQTVQHNDALTIGGYSGLISNGLDPYTASSDLLTGVSQSGPTAPSPAQTLRSQLRFYSLLGVRYVVSAVPLSIPGLRLAGRFTDGLVYENSLALRRAFSVDRVRRIAPQMSAYAVPTWNHTDFSRVAIVNSATALAIAPRAGCAAGARITSYGVSAVTIVEHAGCARLLILSDNDYPGWTATVNGTSAPIYVADGTLRGVVVPRGHNVIRFRYQPASLTLGEAVSAACALAIIASVMLARLRGKGGRHLPASHSVRGKTLRSRG